uniref:Uncharacterized protein n=1 Tax=Tetranychus urticae TaxID=32264 RepID=T1KEY4_TETUR
MTDKDVRYGAMTQRILTTWCYIFPSKEISIPD